MIKEKSFKNKKATFLKGGFFALRGRNFAGG
jgi:hypothetical protein